MPTSKSMTYCGEDKILAGGYLQLTRGRKYIIKITKRRTGSYEVRVAGGFAQTLLRYPTHEAFEREWIL